MKDTLSLHDALPICSAEPVYITILRLANEEEEERRFFIKTSPTTGMIKTYEGRTQQEGSDFYRGRLVNEPW